MDNYDGVILDIMMPKVDGLTVLKRVREKVLLDENGNIILTDTSKIASIDTGKAIEYALEIWDRKTEKGFVDEYRYWQCSYNGEVRIIFLDCRRQLGNFHNFLLTTFGVSCAGFLSVFILMVYLSARIVKPFSDNYEKQKRFITDAGHELSHKGKIFADYGGFLIFQYK